MALNSLGLGFVFTARDLASTKIRGLEKNFRKLDSTSEQTAARFDKGLRQMGTGMAVFTAGAVGLGASFKLAGAAGEFDQGLAKVQAITQATSADLKLLEKAALNAGLATQFSPTEAVDGLGALGAVGFNAKESVAALKPSLDLAAGGMIGVEDATKTVAAGLKVFGLEADQAGNTADKLLKISNLTALQAGDLELALGTVAKGAGVTKQSMDEMLISMGLMKNTGVSANVAASSVGIALQNMAKKSKKFKKELGISVTDSNGKFKDFLTIVQEVNEKTKGIKNEAKKAKLLQELFGRGLGAVVGINAQLNKGVRDVNGNLLKGADAVKELRSQMGGAQGTAKKFTSIMQDTFKGQVTLLKGSLQTLAITLGRPIAEVLKPVIAALIATINGLINAFNRLPGPVKKVLAIFGLVASAATAAGGAFLFFRGAALILGPAMRAAMVAMSGMLAPLLPFLPIIAAVAAAFFMLKHAFDENIGGFGDDMREVFAEISEAVMEIVDIFVQELLPVFVEIFKAFLPIIKMVIKLFAKLLKALLPILTITIKVFAKIMVPVLKVVATMLKVVIGIIEAMLRGFQIMGEGVGFVFGKLADVLSPIFDFIIGAMRSVLEFVKGILETIEDVIDKAVAAHDFVTDAGADFFDDITPGFVDDFFNDGAKVRPETAEEKAASTARIVAARNKGAVAAAARAKAANVNVEGTTTNVTVEIDGEKVAASVAKTQQKNREREFGGSGR